MSNEPHKLDEKDSISLSATELIVVSFTVFKKETYMRVSHSGNAPAFRAVDRSSILLTRSKKGVHIMVSMISSIAIVVLLSALQFMVGAMVGMVLGFFLRGIK